LKTTPQNLLLFALAVVVIAFVYVFIYYPRTPLAKQLRNLKLASGQSRVLRDRFKGEALFQQVKIAEFTAWGGCVMVGGVVPTEEDIRSVTNKIGSISSPVPIAYFLSTSNQEVFFRMNVGENGEWLRTGSQ